jgi:hypothetical protein
MGKATLRVGVCILKRQVSTCLPAPVPCTMGRGQMGQIQVAMHVIATGIAIASVAR